MASWWEFESDTGPSCVDSVKTAAMKSPRTMLLCVFLASAGATGCEVHWPLANPASLKYTEDAHAAYQEAMRAFDDERWIDALA